MLTAKEFELAEVALSQGRNTTYQFQLQRADTDSLVQLITDLLLSLHREGRQPMAPVDTTDRTEKVSNEITAL